MKCKFIKKTCFFALMISASIINIAPVSASSLLDDVGITEINGDYAEDTSYSLLRGNNLNYGTGSISKLSSIEVSVAGTTQCHHECDTAYLSLYLERKVNGSYSTYKSWDFTADNVSHLTKSLVVIVPSGYYYRVRGYHAPKDGGVKESTSTLSSGILVN